MKQDLPLIFLCTVFSCVMALISDLVFPVACSHCDVTAVLCGCGWSAGSPRVLASDHLPASPDAHCTSTDSQVEAQMGCGAGVERYMP